MRSGGKRGIWVAWLCAFACFAIAAPAEEPSPAPVIRTQMLVVQFPQEIGLRLRPMLRNEDTIAKAVDEIQTLIADGKAKLVGAPVLWTLSGDRAVAESFDEIRYGCEYGPPQIPCLFGFRASVYLTYKEQALRFMNPTDVPTSFETRNAGVILEIQPVAQADGRTISIDLVPQHVAYLGEWPALRNVFANCRPFYFQPKFRVSKTTTSLTLDSGQWTLMNVSIIPGSPNTWEACLLRCTILPES